MTMNYTGLGPGMEHDISFLWDRNFRPGYPSMDPYDSIDWTEQGLRASA